jgi:hypothetical protein
LRWAAFSDGGEHQVFRELWRIPPARDAIWKWAEVAPRRRVRRIDGVGLDLVLGTRAADDGRIRAKSRPAGS